MQHLRKNYWMPELRLFKKVEKRESTFEAEPETKAEKFF